MNFNAHFQKVGDWLATSGLQVFLIVVLMVIALVVARTLSGRLFLTLLRRVDDIEAEKRRRTLSGIVRNLLSAVVYIVAGLMILKEIGIEIGPILAAAGIVGLAVGFGAQSLVKDVISGFFILLEDQIRVGDVVEVAGKGGLVEKINLKTTILRDLAGNVHYVPNGQIVVVTNMTKGFSRYLFDIGVAYREDVDEVIEVIKQVDEELRGDPDFKDDILEPIEVLGLDQFADSALIIKARTTTRPIQQWRVAREFNRRLKKAFDARGIEIPFPHVTLYLGEDKQGQAAALRVKLGEGGKTGKK